METLKISYVVFDYTKPGGIEKYVRNLARIYSDEGHEIHVFSAVLPKLPESSLRFHIIPIPKWLPTYFQLRIFARKTLQLLSKSSFDIIHSQGADCTMHNVLTAHSCHRAWVEESKRFSIWEFVKKTLNPFHYFLLRNERYNYAKGNYRAIIAVSKTVGKEIVHYYNVPKKDIRVIYLGTDVPEFECKRMWRDEIRQQHLFAQNDIVILFVANEFRRKGLRILIKSLSLLRDKRFKLLVVGKGRRMFYRVFAFMKRVSVVFIPQTNNVAAYYDSSDLFVFPTRHDAFGMVVAEAMAHGIPVLVSKNAGVAEIIPREDFLISDFTNADEIAERIRILAQRNLQETGTELQAKVQHYTWELMAKRTMEVYRKARMH